MNDKLDYLDDIEILDDFDDQSVSTPQPQRHVDETVRSQLSAFANQRLNNYRGTYSEARKTEINPMVDEKIEIEPNFIEEVVVDDLLSPKQSFQSESMIKYSETPEIIDDFDEVLDVALSVQPKSSIVDTSLEMPIEKTPPLERTTEMLTIPELEKTAVYPSGVITLEKNEPTNEVDTSSKNKNALLFIIGLFILLLVVIFVVLPLVNPI